MTQRYNTYVDGSLVLGSPGPTRADLFARDFVWSGANTTVPHVLQTYGHYVTQVAPAVNGDTITITFDLVAGTYTFHALGEHMSDNGIIDWNLDGAVLVNGQDWYAAAVARDIVKDTLNVSVIGGTHTLTGTINGKNVLSTAFFFRLTKVWFE